MCEQDILIDSQPETANEAFKKPNFGGIFLF